MFNLKTCAGFEERDARSVGIATGLANALGCEETPSEGQTMAGGWARDGAVSEQIEASISDELSE